jgi:hypothetical protein
MKTPNPAAPWATKALLGLLLLAGILAGAWTSHQRAAELDGMRNAIAALQDARRPQQGAPAVVREIRTLMHDNTAEGSREPTASGATQAAVPASAAQPSSEAELSPEEREYRTQVIVAAQDKALDEAYARESSDPDWSSSAAALLRTSFSGQGLEGLTVEPECRSSICRVTFSYTDDAALLQARNLILRTPWPAARNSNVNMATKTGVLYVAREGHELPTVDAASMQF